MFNINDLVNQFFNSYDWIKIENKIAEINNILNNNSSSYENVDLVSLRKELSFLNDVFEIYKDAKFIYNSYEKVEIDLKNETDSEMILLFELEKESLFESLKEKVSELESKIYVVEKEQERSVFLEIRAGAGGLEASLFVADLARMYTLYSQKQNWNISIIDLMDNGIGGYKEIIMHIEGKRVFEKLRYEVGVHRVQRVPDTENSGRVHTSTVTVAVLPEAEEVEVNIDQKDLRIDTYRASGAGGQHVNKTDSAVRITHIPTGTVVACQDERSQHKNKAKAMKILQARIYAAEKEKNDSKMAKMRKDMVATADRSEKIRTYNFPQNRVSDHQINLTINRLEYIMQGELDEIIIELLNKGKIDRNINPYFLPFVL